MSDHSLHRRQFNLGLLAPALLGPWAGAAQAQERRFAPQVAGWRTFDVTTTVQVADVQGATRLWLPVPDVESDYQRSVSNDWSGNAANARLVSDPVRGVRMLYAEFPAGVAAPASGAGAAGDDKVPEPEPVST